MYYCRTHIKIKSYQRLFIVPANNNFDKKKEEENQEKIIRMETRLVLLRHYVSFRFDHMLMQIPTVFHMLVLRSEMSQLMRLWYLPHSDQRRLRRDSPEPSLFAHMKYGSRRNYFFIFSILLFRLCKTSLHGYAKCLCINQKAIIWHENNNIFQHADGICELFDIYIGIIL